MSLNQNMSTSSSSSSSSSDHGIPKFPDNTKVDYVYWRMMMRACLAGRGLWFGVVVTETNRCLFIYFYAYTLK